MQSLVERAIDLFEYNPLKLSLINCAPLQIIFGLQRKSLFA